MRENALPENAKFIEFFDDIMYIYNKLLEFAKQGFSFGSISHGKGFI
jgi:hypothetical protein